MLRKSFLGLAIVASLGIFVTAPAQVVLNEILYDTVSDDNLDSMFTELWGPAGFNLEGWTLVGINGNNGGQEYLSVTLHGSIPGDGYFVVGATSLVPNVDQVVAGLDWQNAGSTNPSCDGLDLRDSDGNTVDHLCYGQCDDNDVCTGEGGTNAPDAWPQGNVNHSIARIPDHYDSDDNAADWQIPAVMTPGAANETTPCVPHYLPLSEVQRDNAQGAPVWQDSFVVTRGIVNVDNYTLDSLTRSNFYIQDAQAGCDVFRGSVPANIVEGDCVVVSGWVGLYYGLAEIVSSGSGTCVFEVRRVAHVDPPLPVVLTCDAEFEAFEGMLARINNVSIVGGDAWPTEGRNANVHITDGNAVMIMRIDRDTQIDGTPQPSGVFSVVGIITQFDTSGVPWTDGYQIMPRYTRDIVRTAADDRPSGYLASDFTLIGAFPNPFNAQAEIRFDVGTARALTLSIYDVLGREVRRELLSGLSSGSHRYIWTPDGATGLYLVRLASASRTQTAKALYLR